MIARGKERETVDNVVDIVAKRKGQRTLRQRGRADGVLGTNTRHVVQRVLVTYAISATRSTC